MSTFYKPVPKGPPNWKMSICNAIFSKQSFFSIVMTLYQVIAAMMGLLMSHAMLLGSNWWHQVPYCFFIQWLGFPTPSFIMHASYSQSSMYPDILYGGCSVGIVPSSSQRQCKAVWTPGAIGHILQCPTTAHSPSHPSPTVGHLLSRLPHLPCKPTVPSAAVQLSVILMFPPFPPRIPPSPSGHHPALYPQEII